MIVVSLGDVRSTRPVLPHDGERLPDAVLAVCRDLFLDQTVSHTPPNGLGHRDPEPIGPASQPPVLSSVSWIWVRTMM